MRNLLQLSANIALICSSLVLSSAERKGETIFKSKGGWDVSYPSSWHLASCHNCTDPHAAGVYVDFLPPQSNESQGWITIEPLADKPVSARVEDWLTQLATSANQNRVVLKEGLRINDLPALRVRYRTPQGEFMEAVYLVSGSKTVSMSFYGREKQNVAPGSLGNYAVFSAIVHSFHMQHP